MSASNIERPWSPWPHRLAIVLAAATLLLMLVGGTVTSLNAGDTEPSWSLRFWEWFQPPSQLLEKEGHIWEIGHRQIGTVVGFLMIAFVVLLQRGEPRRWVRRLGWLAFAGVVAQGALGGLRVLVVSDEGDGVRSTLAIASDAGGDPSRRAQSAPPDATRSGDLRFAGRIAPRPARSPPPRATPEPRACATFSPSSTPASPICCSR